MAEPSLRHDTRSTQDPNEIAPYDGAGAFHSSRFVDNDVDEALGASNNVSKSSSAHEKPVSLPLRQASKQPVTPQTRIHDITEKFTSACNSKFSRSLQHAAGHMEFDAPSGCSHMLPPHYHMYRS